MKLLTTPIVKVADLPAGIELGPDEWATAAVALSALILAFMYFALGWSTNRMDATHSARFPSRGSPALICWTSAAGLLSFAILGTHFFAPMFFALNSNLYI